MSLALSYAEAGDGPTVVCLHGIGGGAESFAPQIGMEPPLEKRRMGGQPPTPPGSISGKMKEGRGLSGFRVIAWDMPGYGGSATGDWPLSFEGLSGRLAAFLDGRGLERVHLVGHSIGGMIALDFALRHPDRVATMALIGTTPAFGGRDPSFAQAFLKARLGPLDAGQTMPEMAAEAARGLVGSAASQAAVADIETVLAAVPEATWRGILECLVTFDRRADLGQVSQPCCLIAGSEDRNAPPRTMEKMAAALPGAEYHLLDGVGHMINQEAPERVNAILGAFFRRHPT